MDSESIVPWDGREIKLDKLKEGLKKLIHSGLSPIPAYESPGQVQFSEIARRPKGWYHTPERSEPNHGQDSQPAQPHAGGEGGLPAAAPGLSQRFAASIPLDTADYAGTEVILGNPPPAALRHAPALR